MQWWRHVYDVLPCSITSHYRCNESELVPDKRIRLTMTEDTGLLANGLPQRFYQYCSDVIWISGFTEKFCSVSALDLSGIHSRVYICHKEVEYCNRRRLQPRLPLLLNLLDVHLLRSFQIERGPTPAMCIALSQFEIACLYGQQKCFDQYWDGYSLFAVSTDS